MADASPVPAGAPAQSGGVSRPNDVTLRLYDAVPVAPVWVGLGVVLAYLALFLVVARFSGSFRPLGEASQVLLWETVNAVIVGYLLTVNVIVVRKGRRDLEELKPRLNVSEEGFRQLVNEATNPSARGLLLYGLLGVAGGAVLPLFDSGIWGGGPTPPLTSALFLWVAFHNALIGWAGMRNGVTETALTRGFTRAADLVSIDLLDTRALSPFARKSQRSLMGWAGFSVLFSLFFLGDTPADANRFFLILIVGVLLAVFFTPLAALRRRISAAKAEELSRVNEKIRRAQQGGTAAEEPSLADWVGYRGLIEGVREWPINTSGLLRALLFAALGVGSWLGGALVERFLGTVLD